MTEGQKRILKYQTILEYLEHYHPDEPVSNEEMVKDIRRR